jgi:hypothetical protein|eukprot:COSAG03_NODE_1330_length_4313_cov_2.657095_1_plen_221_part_00
MPRLVPSDRGDLEQPLLTESNGRAARVAQIQSASASDSARDRALAAEEEEPECRYCKENGPHSVSGSPLIAPCSCKGSMKYVHAEPCLRLWLETRHAGEAMPKCEICNEAYAIAYEERFMCSLRALCNAESWNSYFECVGVCVMIGCLVTTLWVLFASDQTMEFAELTNYAVMAVLALVLLFASMVTVKKISSRWWRNNSVTTLTPTSSRPAAPETATEC